MGKYWSEAVADAWETGREFADCMVEQFKHNGQVSDDLNNDYGDGDEWHHLQHVDKEYNLTEAAAILDELSEYEETDSGLWDNSEPRHAIACQAAYTYGNAVYDLWQRHVIEELNGYLDALDDTLPEVEDGEDNQKDYFGEMLIRFFVLVGEDLDGTEGDERALLRAAFDSIQQGETTPAAVLADWCDEHDQSSRARDIRQICHINITRAA